MFALAPAVAQADTPVLQNGTYVYSPMTGAELVSDVAAAKAGSQTARIELTGNDGTGARLYLINQTISLGASDHIQIVPKYTVLGDNDQIPAITSTSTMTMFKIAGAGNAVYGAQIFTPDDGSTASLPIVELDGNATFGGGPLSTNDRLHYTQLFTGGADEPNVVSILAKGSGNTVQNVLAGNGSPSPAIRTSGDLSVLGATLTGGNPTIDLDYSGETIAHTTTIASSQIAQGGATSLVRIKGGSAATTVHLVSSILNADEVGDDPVTPPSALVDVVGPTAASGSLNVDVANDDLFGYDSTPASIRVTPGAGTTTVPVTGLFNRYSTHAVQCVSGGSGTVAASVSINGIWRGTSDLAPLSGACSISETGLVTAADPLVDGDNAPIWNSPLVDKLPASSITYDRYFSPRVSSGPHTSSSTPTDIGAVEYQYLPPTVDATATNVDSSGLVEFDVDAGDSDQVGSGQEFAPAPITITWHLPDGSTATGTSVQWKYTIGNPPPISVTATDVTGLSTTVEVQAHPPLPNAVVPTPTPTPTPTPATVNPTPTPTANKTPTPTPTPAPVSTKVLASFGLINSRISKSAVKPSGIGKPASNEAGMQITLSKPATLTMVARTQKGTKYGAITGARVSFKAPVGPMTLHLSSKIGKVRLKPGLYRMTLLVTPAAGAVERQDFSIRVK